MEKSLKDYILTAKKEYHYRIKTAFELNEAKVAIIERAGAKYGMVEMTAPKRIILSKNPLDFKNVENAEVHYVDMTCSYPASTEMFHQELRQKLNVAEKLLLVRDLDHDPYEKYIEEINHRKEVLEKGDYKTKLLDPEYKSDGHTEEQAPTHYGNEYLEKFKDAQDEPRHEEKKRVTNNKKVGSAEDFNKDIKKGKGKGKDSIFTTVALPPMPPMTKG